MLKTLPTSLTSKADIVRTSACAYASASDKCRYKIRSKLSSKFESSEGLQ